MLAVIVMDYVIEGMGGPAVVFETGRSLGSLLWLVTSILMSVWVVWLGVALTRSPDRATSTADAR